jgi:hypothetical protein
MYAAVNRNVSVSVSGCVRRDPSAEIGVMKETEAKEDRLSIAAYNTHHRSAAHTDPRFYPQGPKQMEPA